MSQVATQIVKCSFCDKGGLDSNHFLKDNEGTTVCPVILNHLCTYCKKKGHTNKNCPVAKANYLQRKVPSSKKATTSDATQPKMSPNSWAGKFWNNLSMEEQDSVVSKNLHDEKIQLEQQLADNERKQNEIVAKRQTMMAKYPSIMEGKLGQFWPFYVEGTSRENGCVLSVAKEHRTVALGQQFEEFLLKEYGESWLTDSENSKHDCSYLATLRVKTITQRKANTEAIARAETERIQLLRDNLSPEAFQQVMEIEFKTFTEQVQDVDAVEHEELQAVMDAKEKAAGWKAAKGTKT